MPEKDFDYLSRRADEELAAAAKAGNTIAAGVHRELADRFRLRAQELKAALLDTPAPYPNKVA